MMEASDVTGELRICMQIIATCGKEMEVYGSSVLDQETDFRKLITLFTELNNITYRRHKKMSTDEDATFLKKNQISDVALMVAEAVYQAVTKASEESPEFWSARR